MAVTAPAPDRFTRRGAITGGTVLMGFANALAAPETAWSLLESGTHVVAFVRRGAQCALRRSREVEIIEITAPEEDARAAVGDLRAALADERYGALMPLDDTSLWLCNAAAAGGLPVPVVGPTGTAAELALDKALQIAAAQRAGLAVPPTCAVHALDDLDALSEFPLVLKPSLAMLERDGRLARGSAHVCANAEELATAGRAWNGTEAMLAQPFIGGTGEGLFGLAGPDGLTALSAHRRIRMANPQGSGSSACVSIDVDPQLAAAAERMLTEAGWQGMFMLEFLRGADGTPWFMELNGRPWGSMALARRVGLEYPAWAVRRLDDPGFEPVCDARTGQVCRHLGRELVHLLMVMRGPRSVALTQWPSRRETLRDVLRVRRSDRWYNWRRGELALFAEDTIRTVHAHLPKRGRR
jgi:hypothetical protein